MSEALPDGPLALEQSLLRRALAARDPGRLHLRFRIAVVDRYRAMPRAQLLRTRTVGRVSLAGRWSVDVGIVDDGGAPAGGAEVHLPFQDLVDRVPEEEWPHWIEHLVAQPASGNFLQMRMTAAACIDDGETERWDA